MFGLEGLACQANLKFAASTFCNPIMSRSAVANQAAVRNRVKLWKL